MKNLLFVLAFMLIGTLSVSANNSENTLKNETFQEKELVSNDVASIISDEQTIQVSEMSQSAADGIIIIRDGNTIIIIIY